MCAKASAHRMRARVVCGDNSADCGTPSARVELNAEAGREYFIFADTHAYGSVTSPFLLQVTRQAVYGSAAAAFLPKPWTLLD